MKSKHLHLIIAAVAAWWFVSPAHAVDVQLTGTVHTTAISGFAGSAYTLGTSTSTTHALYGGTSFERSDNPCYVKVTAENVNDTSDDTSDVKDLCGPNGYTSSAMTADFGDGDITGTRSFVSGAMVCMNSGQSKVKGIRFYGKEINANGDLVDLATYAWDSRTNCSTWKQRVDCPAGELATAAEIHFAAGNTPRSWTGIKLKCRAVALK